MLRIVPHPHPALRYESRPVAKIDEALRGWVREMFALMYEARGIGLAANQVGLPFRFFVLNLTADPAQPEEERVYLNPAIVKRHSSFLSEEGCLSFPGLYADVQRAKRIRVQAYDLEGRPIEEDATDLLGRAIQHETDHVDGKLFIDRLAPDVRDTVEVKVKGFEAEFRKAQAAGEWPSDDEIRKQLDAMAAGETPP